METVRSESSFSSAWYWDSVVVAIGYCTVYEGLRIELS